ncbi:MAG: hypothetical protein ACFCVK_04590 [Acidimicrobiales bacterium]
MIGLADGARREVVDFDAGSRVSAWFSPSGDSLMVTGANDRGGRTVLIELASGRIVAEADLRGIKTVDSGFLAIGFGENTGEFSFVGAGGTTELPPVATDDSPDFGPSGRTLALSSVDGGRSMVWSAPIGDGGVVGEPWDIVAFDSPVDLAVLDEGRVVAASADGAVVAVERGNATEIGRLAEATDSDSAQIFRFDEQLLTVSNGASAGVVTTSGETNFIPLPDGETALVSHISSDRRWLAVRSSEPTGDGDDSSDLLVLVDLDEGRSFTVDQAESIFVAGLDDERVYYRTASWDGERGDGARLVDPEISSVALQEGARPELIVDDVSADWVNVAPRYWPPNWGTGFASTIG